MSTNRLYVSNIPFALNDAQLADYFGKVGAVAGAKVVVDRFSGRSKGFAFVEMESVELAERAINDLNGQELMGRKILVAFAKPQQDKPGGFDRSRGGSR